MAKQRIGRWGMKKAAFKEMRQMESLVEAGQSTIGNVSRVSF
jgi:hypothetical protein